MRNLVSAPYAWQYRARQWAAGRLCRLRRRGETVAALTRDPERVLLILAGMIGDTVMSTPVVIEARRLWPRARITVLGRQHNCELLAPCPLIDACVECAAIPFSLRKWRGVARLKQWLRSQDFDLAVIILGDQYPLMLAEAGVPVRVGVRGTALEPCLTHTYDVGSPRTWGPPERLGALRALGCDVRDVPPRLWVSEGICETARLRLAELGLPTDSPYALVHPFGSARHRWWPIERVAELAAALWRQYGLWTVVVGGAETRGEMPACPAAGVVDASGRLTIRELLGGTQEARLVISTDSGPFHVAGALGRPLVGLFRAKRPEHGAHYPQALIVSGQDPACDGPCRWDRCQTTPCRQLLAISTADVLRITRLLQSSDSTHFTQPIRSMV